MRQTAVAHRMFHRLLCGGLIAAILAVSLPACASGPRYGDGPLGPLFPRPIGSTSIDDAPIACIAEWTGFLVGAAGFGALGYHGDVFGPNAHNVGRGLALGVVGGCVGSILMAGPGYLLQWLWDTITGRNREPAPEGDPAR